MRVSGMVSTGFSKCRVSQIVTWFCNMGKIGEVLDNKLVPIHNTFKPKKLCNVNAVRQLGQLLQTIHTCRNHTDVANIVLFNVNETVRFCIIHNVIHVLCLKRVYDLINTILLLLYLRFSPVKLFISIALIYVTSVNDASLYETWGSTFTPCTALV